MSHVCIRNGRLLTDNFYNGTPWFTGMDRIQIGQQSKLAPLSSQSPFYLPKRAWPSFPPDGQLAQVTDIQALPEYEAVLKANARNHRVTNDFHAIRADRVMAQPPKHGQRGHNSDLVPNGDGMSRTQPLRFGAAFHPVHDVCAPVRNREKDDTTYRVDGVEVEPRKLIDPRNRLAQLDAW